MPIRRDCPTGNILEQATLLPGVEQQGEEGGQQQEGGQEARRPVGGGDDLERDAIYLEPIFEAVLGRLDVGGSE